MVEGALLPPFQFCACAARARKTEQQAARAAEGQTVPVKAGVQPECEM